MNKRLLILTDPYSSPAYAPRLRYFCDYFTETGWTVDVYTEQFEPHHFEHKYSITEIAGYHHFLDWAVKSVWSLLTDWRNRHFSKEIQKLVSPITYDAVFCTTFSTFPLRAAAEIAQQKKIPLFVDIRDLDEQVPNAQYQSHRAWWARPFRKWYQHMNILRRNKELRKADCITTVSPWHVEFIKQFNPNVHLIYNGYAPELFYPADIRCDKFLISYIGRIYEFQSTELIERAIKEINNPEIVFNLHTPTHRPIPNQEVGHVIRNSSIMLVLTNPEAKGMMTTKFYEAIGCQKPVLCIPSDNGLLAQTIADTHAGLASSDINEIKAFILQKYAEWKQNGYTRQICTAYTQFSRRYQAQQLKDLIDQKLSTQPPLVCDICWTLYRSNTTFDFLDHVIQEPSYLRLRRWMRHPLIRKVNLLLLKLFHRDMLRARALRYLSQWTEEEIDQMAELFVNTQLESKRIEKVWDMLRERDIIIVSGTIRPVAKAVAQRLGAKKIYSGDIFKKQALAELNYFDIVTDNLSDKDLIRKAKYAYIVTYGNQDRWNRMHLTNAEYLTDEDARY